MLAEYNLHCTMYIIEAEAETIITKLLLFNQTLHFVETFKLLVFTHYS